MLCSDVETDEEMFGPVPSKPGEDEGETSIADDFARRSLKMKRKLETDVSKCSTIVLILWYNNSRYNNRRYGQWHQHIKDTIVNASYIQVLLAFTVSKSIYT